MQYAQHNKHARPLQTLVVNCNVYKQDAVDSIMPLSTLVLCVQMILFQSVRNK